MSTSFGGGILKSLSFTDSWGISPGSGQALMPGNDFGLESGDDFALTFGGRTVFGVVKNPILKRTTDGYSWEATLVDNREKLAWDSLACQFNVIEIEEVDPANFGKTRRRRYKHIKPNDWHAQIVTYTQNPLTASAILALVFGADTVAYPWSNLTHGSLSKPVYNLDFDTGTELGAIIQQIMDKLGLVVCLSGEYQLEFAVKGEGALPTITGANIKESSIGTALSGNPTRVRIIGDRDIYTDTNIALVPDWKAPWQAYLFEGNWIEAVRAAYSLPVVTPSDRAKLAAKARMITVLDWMIKKSDPAFADYGRFGDVGRMHLPAWVYITQIVFKAYRIPGTYTLNGIELKNLKIWEGLLARVTADATTGVMSYYTSGGQFEIYTDDKAYIVATGQQLDLSDPAKRDVLDPATIVSLSALWTPCQRFRIDPRNFSVVFEDAVFQPGEDGAGLLTFVNADSDLPVDHPSRNLAIPNADFTLTAPSIKGAFSFEAERYYADFGSGLKATAHYVSGLALHALMLNNVFNTEIKYDTSPAETVAQKAQKAAASYLAKAEFYASGSFTRLGAWGTSLTATIDRVSFNLNDQGIREDIDLTKERSADYFEPERELDRAKTSDDLYPTMRANREEARGLEYQARVLAGLSVKQSRAYKDLSDVFKVPLGNSHPGTTYFTADVAYDGGECVFTNDSGAVDDAGMAFQGVVTAKNVASGVPMPVATQGVVPVKIQGSVETGASVGCDSGSKIAKAGGERSVGVCLHPYTGAGTVWLPVRLNSGGGSGVSDAEEPYELIDASTPADGCRLMVSLNSWLSQSKNPDDNQPITGLGVPFPIAVDQWIYIEVEYSLTVPFPIVGVNIAQDDRDSDVWTGGSKRFLADWDDPDAENRKQTKARRLIGFTRSNDAEDIYPVKRMTITGGTGDDAVSMQVVQSLKTHLLLCEDCLEGDKTVKMLVDFSHVPYIPPPDPDP